MIKVYQKKSNTQFKDYCIWQNSSVNSLFDQMAWKDQKSNMNCFHQTFLILLRSRTINRQKNMPTLLSICALGNEQFLSKCTPLENSWFIWWNVQYPYDKNECWLNKKTTILACSFKTIHLWMCRWVTV